MPRPVDLDRILVCELTPGAAERLKGEVCHEDLARAPAWSANPEPIRKAG
jgi:hypothetical protein